MIVYLKKFFNGKELLPPKATILQLLISLFGGTLSILVLVLLSNYSRNLFISAPFGASCVILYALPKSPLAQPRNVFFGYVLSVSVGIFFLKYILIIL